MPTRKEVLQAESVKLIAEWWNGLSEAERDTVRDHADRYAWVMRGNRGENLRYSKSIK